MKALHRNDAPGRRAKPFVFRSTVIATIVLSSLISSIKGEVKKKHISFGRNFSCFSAHSIEPDWF
jgi:hypothetical protein